MPLERQLCTFRLGGTLFGLEADRVQEVLRLPGLSPVPLAPPPVSGLMNLRGQVLTVLDLRGPLGLPSRPPEEAGMCLVLKSGNEWIGLEIDEVGDVVEAEESWFEEAPTALAPPARRLIRGAYKLKRKLLLALDAEAALKAEA